MSASGKAGTCPTHSDPLLNVLNLYHKLRFGQFDGKQPVIVDLAMRIGRTPGAVPMKLSNGISARKPSATDLRRKSGRNF